MQRTVIFNNVVNDVSVHIVAKTMVDLSKGMLNFRNTYPLLFMVCIGDTCIILNINTLNQQWECCHEKSMIMSTCSLLVVELDY